MIKVKTLAELKGTKVSVNGMDIALTGMEVYKNKTGKETMTLLSVGTKFEGDVIGRTDDGYEIRLKGYMYAKKLVEKPEEVRAGKLL